MSIEIISALVGLILTLMIFSYLIGDNPLFRIAVYLFICVSSGYAATVVWYSVLVPKLFQPLTARDPNQFIFFQLFHCCSASRCWQNFPHAFHGSGILPWLYSWV